MIRKYISRTHTIDVQSGRQPKAQHPDVSLIVPVHNKKNYVLDTLQSALSQDLDSLEVICIDDASSDGSFDIIAGAAEQDARLRLFRMPRTGGAGLARNFGLTQARGRYVQFLDADDLLPPGSIKLLFHLAQTTGSEMVRGGVAAFVDDDIWKLGAIDIPPNRQSYRLSDEPHLWIPWWHQAYLIHRQWLITNEINYPNLTDGEDPVFLSHCLTRASSISSTSFIVYHYRRHAQQVRDNPAFLDHARLARSVLLNYDPRVWFEGYGAFLVDEVLPHRLALRSDGRAPPAQGYDMIASLMESGRSS